MRNCLTFLLAVIVGGTLALADSSHAASSAEKKSAKSSGGDFTFLVAGDHFEEPPKGLVAQMVAQKPRLVITTGDLVYKSSLSDFKDFKKVILAPLKAIGADYYPCLGNHDFPIDNWKKLWGDEKGKNYYSFDHGNAHFITLDTNKAGAPDGKKFKDGSEKSHMQRQGKNFHKGSEQYKWLEQDLKATKKKFIFVTMHYPVLSFGGHKSEVSIQKELSPLFEKYKVTAVFTGHDHNYQRFVPVKFDQSGGTPKAVADAKGVPYIVTGSGTRRNNLYDIKKNALHAKFKKVANFVVISISGNTVKGRTLTPSGEVIDTFELKSWR